MLDRRAWILAVAALALPAAAHGRTVTLVYDAVYTKARIVDKAPAGDSVGDRQVVSGKLHDPAGKTVGTFGFTCRYVAIVNGDAHERCQGTGRTADGAIAFQGPARKSDQDHSWTFRGTSGDLLGAHGRGAVHDATPDDSVVVMTVSLPAGRRLPDGTVPRASANNAFIKQVKARCATESQALHALPPFPLQDFDPLNPTPEQLQTVGQFFSGPGDARPPERTLLAQLQQLGKPPVGAAYWQRVMAAIPRIIASQTEQTDAAVAVDVARWITAVRATEPVVRSLSLAIRAFGVPSCDPS